MEREKQMVLRANRLMRVLSVSSERQVVTLDTLGEYLPGQMHLARHLSGIASPVITGDKAYLEWRKQAQQPTACLIVAWAKGICQDLFSLGIKGIPKPMSMLFIGAVSQINHQATTAPAPSDRYTRGFLTGRPRVLSLFMALTYAITSPTWPL